MAPTRQSKRKEKVEWLNKEKQAWKPPERLTVSEWADKYRILSSKYSAFPGPWKTSRTPYTKEPMDAFNDSEIEKLVLCCASQVAKTEIMLNILGYVIDQDQSPTLIVYPTLDLAEFASKNRIDDLLKTTTVINDKYLENESKVLELQFLGMYIALSGANSPASLASRPIRYLLMDEVDKFPPYSGKEADPISLASERTKTFHNRKIFMCSTPTVEIGNIWREYQGADLKKKYYVPCPHCGHYQKLEFKQIKWPEELHGDHKKVRDAAWYECESCKQAIHDKDKITMLRGGEWRAENEPSGRIRSVAYHLNSIYSPMVSFGDVAAEFLRSKDFPEKLRNFINSWLGEPWVEKANKVNADLVLEKQWTHERGKVPDGALLLTASVDVQKDHFWYSIRAWGERLTSWLVEYGRAETWNEIEEVIVNRTYRDKNGESFLVNLALIDSGYRTDEVYEFCSLFPEVCKPCKGSSNPMRAPYAVTNIEKEGYGGLKLWIVDGHYYKDFISGRLKKETGDPGSWMIFKDCPREYADQICSEQKVIIQDRKTGRIKEEWQKVGSHAQNHLLDTEVYNVCAAEILGVRYLQAPEPEPPKRESEQENKSGWIKRGSWPRR